MHKGRAHRWQAWGFYMYMITQPKKTVTVVGRWKERISVLGASMGGSGEKKKNNTPEEKKT